MLATPLVGDEFPYLLYSAPSAFGCDGNDHRFLEASGLNGTAVYRTDDPAMQRFWPPWEDGCACLIIPLNIEDAAARGVLEAQEWVRTGDPPSSPQHVPLPSRPADHD